MEHLDPEQKKVARQGNIIYAGLIIFGLALIICVYVIQEVWDTCPH